MDKVVYVAIYEHRYDTDVRVFGDEAKAEEWRQEIAQEWWWEIGKPMPEADTPKAIADLYFSAKGDLGSDREFFNVTKHMVE